MGIEHLVVTQIFRMTNIFRTNLTTLLNRPFAHAYNAINKTYLFTGMNYNIKKCTSEVI